MNMDCKGWLILKWLISVGLAFGFFFTTLFNLIDFLSEKTTMSIGEQTYPDGLELPAITICNETAYKNFEMNLDKESYLKNTLNLEDFFVNLNSEGKFIFTYTYACI